ncbi:MAG: NAD(P)-binding protein [Bacteroidetes bacterium]|nr:NAD(P)-binding protein [Bacteroidota bacterium]
MGNTVIVGTGVSGLLSALILTQKKSSTKIYLLDKSSEPGGLLRAFDYGKFGKFDYGMHNMLETSIPELDKLIFDLLPENEWQLLKDNKRDLAGIYFNGKLQKETPYFDLRNLPENEYKKSIADLFGHIEKKVKNNSSDIKNGSAREFAYSRFGKDVAEKTIIPSVEKIHQKSADELDYMATIFTPMTRLALFDEQLVKDLTLSPILRDYIAYVDQRNLPLERSTGRKAYYPIKYGMYRIVEALKNKLEAYGVEFLLESEVKAINSSNNSITEVEVKTPKGDLKITNIDNFIWTGNIPLLGRLMGAKFDGLKNDKPLKTVIISFLLDKKLAMDDLYYFFCYDKKFNTYRLTNFPSYCSGAHWAGGYPISMEFLVSEEFIKSTPSIEKLAEQELFQFGVTQPDTKVLFSKAEVLESGFPMPSLNNINGVKNIRNQIKAMNISNLLTLGILAEDNLFFQTDVLIDTYKKLTQKNGIK